MTVPLHDRLRQIIREAWHRSRAWTPGVQLPADEFADALLASKEWQAREEELARLRALLPDRHWVEIILAQPRGHWFGDNDLRQWARSSLAEHIRLDAGKEEGMMSKKKAWVQPAWMTPYIPLLVNTGGTFDDPAEAMNCDAKNCNLAVNGPRALLCTAVLSQIRLLERLHANGLLA